MGVLWGLVHHGEIMRPIILIGVLVLAIHGETNADVLIFRQTFDSVSPPALPPGWSSSQSRIAGQSDFFTTNSSSRSSPNALQCTNATVAQWILSPVMGGGNDLPAHIAFWTRRSSTFGAGIVVDFALDFTGASFTTISDTLRFSGSTSYELCDVEIPRALRSGSPLRIRWRVVPTASGSTGTFRIDDIEVRGECALDLACGPIIESPGSDNLQTAVRARIRNEGTTAVSSFDVSLFLRSDADSVSRPVRTLGTKSLSYTLEPGDSTWIDFSIQPHAPGGALIASVSCPGDENPGNDSAELSMPISYDRGALVVNEIMFAPAPHEPEWVELLNVTSDTMTLCRWAINDADTSARHAIAKVARIVPPSSFAVLTNDSTGIVAKYGRLPCPVIQVPSFPSLNNDEDMIVIKDHTGATIDSVAYRSSWHNPSLVSATGRSLERIGPSLPSSDPRSWTSCTCLIGGTPGKQNSVYASTSAHTLGLDCSPNPFSPNGDGVNDVALIRYAIPLRVATISAYVYDVRGRRIRRLADHDPGTLQGVLVWDGKRDDGIRAPVGMYIVLLQAVEADGGNLYEARCVVVLAMPM